MLPLFFNYFLHLSDVNNLKKLFKELDTDKSGYLTKKELQEGFIKVGISCTCEEVDDMIKCCSKDGDDRININEFLNALG